MTRLGFVYFLGFSGFKTSKVAVEKEQARLLKAGQGVTEYVCQTFGVRLQVTRNGVNIWTVVR